MRESFRDGLRPDPQIDFVEWANTHMRLTKESSVEPGQYRSSRTPWVEEPLIELSPQSPTTEVVFVKPTQIGATVLGNIFLFAIAHLYPGPAMMAMPTDDMAKKHSKKKVAPSVKAIPALRGKIRQEKSRTAGNTLLLKEFPGGSWTFTGSNSPTSARSASVRYLILDDYDGFVPEAGDEGAPGKLFKKRTDAYGNKKKIYINSTPTLAGASNIEREYETSSQGKYHVPCPHCGGMQYLIFGGKDFTHGIKFTRDPIKVWYVCEHCHAKIERWQIAGGSYIHKYPERKKRGFKINSLYSPLGWLSWETIVDEFLEAAADLKRGDPLGMKVWTNTRMADTWEEDGGQPEWVTLTTRAESYKTLQIPAGGLLLCAGVDTHDNRLDVAVKAYGPGEESWLVYWGSIWGDPELLQTWEQLDEILYRPYLHASGTELHIISMAIDTGGHRAQAVYNYARTRSPRVIAVKGASSRGKPIISRPGKVDVDVGGKVIKEGVDIWTVGTDIAKGTIYNRLKLVIPGPGFCHFPIGLEDEYYLQLTAEKLVKRYVKGFQVYEWVNTRAANHALDCEVYCLAAAYRAGMQTINWPSIAARLSVPITLLTEVPVTDRAMGRTVEPRPPRKQVRPRAPGGYTRPSWMG